MTKEELLQKGENHARFNYTAFDPEYDITDTMTYVRGVSKHSFVAGYESSEKNAEQERIKYALEVLKEERDRLHIQHSELIIVKNKSDNDIVRLSGKIEGVKLSIENLRQSISKLESQLKNLQNDRT